LAVAASSSFFFPTAAAASPPPAAAALRPVSPSPLNLVGTSVVPEGTPSPSSPGRQHVQSVGLPAWGPGSPPRSPQPPKEPSNSSGRTGSCHNLLERQGGQKSADMREDVAAAFVVTSSAAKAAAAAVESGQQGLTAGAAVRPASGRSSVSQRLVVARRMAATAGADDADDGDGGPSLEGLSLQLDGSLKRRIASSSVTNLGRTSKDRVQHGNTPAAAAERRLSVLHGSAVQGRKSASLAVAELAPLRPSSGSRTAWLADPIGQSLKAPTPKAGITATPGGTVGGKGGRGSTTPSTTLPELGGDKARGGSGRSGPASPVGGFIGALESSPSAAVDQKPRRNSYSNDASKPSSGTQGARGVVGSGTRTGTGLVVSGGGKLKPSGVGKAVRGSIG
jgi:hypothetical protein